MEKLCNLSMMFTTLLFVSILMSSEVTCMKPVVFSFGDSNTDTGALDAAFGDITKYPYGRNLPDQPSGRSCDGRLILDFMCENLTITSYLTPYLQSVDTNFSSGANFAFAGAGLMIDDSSFNLKTQVEQFKWFQRLSLGLSSRRVDVLVDEDFKDALYLIDIGQNDLSEAFRNKSYIQVLETIPSYISEFQNGIKALVRQGGKSFWVHNTGPLGCLLSFTNSQKGNTSDLDDIGCISSYNDVSKEFNSRLAIMCQQLREELQDITIVYVDIYSIKYEIIANYTSYGFINPLVRCCETCFGVGKRVCENGQLYINWDGVHYTEAANRIVAAKILSTNFSTPPLPISSFFSN